MGTPKNTNNPMEGDRWATYGKPRPEAREADATDITPVREATGERVSVVVPEDLGTIKATQRKMEM